MKTRHEQQNPEPSLFYVFTVLLSKEFPEHIHEFRQCIFTLLDGRVYMWYDPSSEWFQSIGKPGSEDTKARVANAWRSAVESQLSSPWRELYIYPNN